MNKTKETLRKIKDCFKTGFKGCFGFAKANKKVTFLIVLALVMILTLIVTIATL